MVETLSTTCPTDDFSVAEAIQRILNEDVATKTAKFLDDGINIKITPAQQCANMNDNPQCIALVFDMRSKQAFEQCSLDKSINFCVERFNEETFINWKKEALKLEKDTDFLCKHHSDFFKHRKRLWIYIIASQHDMTLEERLKNIHSFSDLDDLRKLVEDAQT